MTLSEIEVALKSVWAKSGESIDVPGATLFQHSIDVVKQMAEYRDLYRPVWPVTDEPICLPRVLAYSAFAHDFGKIHTDFQKVLRGQAARFGNRHEILSLSFLEWLDIPGAERPWIDAAIALHHKNLFLLTAAGQPFHISKSFGASGTDARRLAEGVNADDAQRLYELLRHADEVFKITGWEGFRCYALLPFQPIDYIDAMRRALERVGALAQRFAAAVDDFGVVGAIPWPLRRAGIQMRGLMLLADHLASSKPHLLSVGLDNLSEVETAVKSKSRAKTFTLNSHQHHAARHQGSAILVAPTGSGKTEAALLWSARQAEKGVRGRTFFLLPFQASMNVMQRRLIETFFLEFAKDPGQWATRVAMVHGRSVRAAYERLLEKEYTWIQATQTARIENDLARLDIAPIRVCSPYQILRLLFEPKAVEGLIQSLCQARLIFDEIHAYDPEVTALTLAATQFLTEQLGANVLFMTATLPSHLTDVLQSTFDNIPVLRAGADILDRPIRHQIEILSHDVLSDESINAIVKATERGSVLVVVNQVGRAVELCKTLESSLLDVRLLHSRFTNQDRFAIESVLQPSHRSVLIATQAVEVSLDVSYTACFSELAPMESLLQRFGRCNRYGEQDIPAKVYVYSKFPQASERGSRPYDNAHLLTTLEVLKKCVAERGGFIAEDRIQSMVDCSYTEDLKSELKEQIENKLRLVREDFSRDFMPFGSRDQNHFVELARQWEELFDGHEVLPVSLREKAETEHSWLGRARYFVPLSGHKFRKISAQEKASWDKELMCHVIDAPYTRFGLEV